MLQHSADFVFGRNVDADLQPICVPLLDPGPALVLRCRLPHDIARHFAGRHGLGDDRAEG